MKKFLSRVLTSTMLLCVVGTSLAVETVGNIPNKEITQEIHTDTLSSGECGENATYFFDSATGALTISGTGAMEDYDSSPLPWYSYRDDIKSVVIADGITTIGSYAFRDCTNLTTVTIPNSVTAIKGRAFWCCYALSSVTLGNSITSIGDYAFAYCYSLASVTIPNSVAVIQAGAFSNCVSLSSVTIPNSMTTIEQSTFSQCEALTSVAIPKSITKIGQSAFQDTNSFTTVYYGGSETDRETMNISSYKSYNENLENVTWVYNHSDPSWTGTPEPTKTATPSTAKVMVNGEEVNFGAYNIDGYNYFKLTDMSYALNGTDKQFLVSWDEDKNVINMISGEPHNELGTELQGNSGQNQVADEFFSPVLQDGVEISVVAYTIEGSSYFQLDTLKEIVGISVGWDNDTSTITITA